MTDDRMYSQRASNIPVFRGCSFSCIYCSFKRLVQMNKKCPSCAEFKPHSHMEVLQRKPPRTKEGEFLTIGLSGDVSFMPIDNFNAVLNYCTWWADRTFLIQSKNPEYFLRVIEPINHLGIPDNVILGCTIESDTIYWKDRIGQLPNEKHHYRRISQAPYPEERYEAMMKLTCRKAITIEPILYFDLEGLVKWIKDIAPEFCYVGYCNDGKQGKRMKLPEPPLAKTQELITMLREAGIEIRCKSIRNAWWE